MDEAPRVLERQLAGINQFWDERVIDRAYGGYRLGHDERGHPTGERGKHVVTQARTAWYFARLARSPYGQDRHLQWAAHGIRFLRNCMWDPVHGGFCWRVDPAGPGDARKHLYGQSFGVLALSEFARAADDSDTAALARELVEMIDTHAHDDACGGYFESRNEDWSPEPPQNVSVLGRPSRGKTSNSHLHLMEALTELTLVRPDDALRRRQRELLRVMSECAVDQEQGSCHDTCTRDWVPRPGYPISYGHDVENAWLLQRACHAAEIPEQRLTALLSACWDNALRYGFDHQRGGWFGSGPRSAPADQRGKVWWVQAEGLIGALAMWCFTGSPRYRDAFEHTLGWIDRVQADHCGGDWHAHVDEKGRRSGDKSGPWKDPYHQGRAVLECLELLSR